MGLSFEDFAQKPRFNVAPSQMMPVVSAGADGAPMAALMRWGLVPFWDKSEKPKIAPINARSETAMEKTMFKQSVQKRRCLIPADGFYEWQRFADERKQPYDIHLRGRRPFFMAGIFEDATETRPATYLLFTTRPNELMLPIHDRMPAILTGEKAVEWIRPGPLTPEAFTRYVEPYAATQMEALPVSALVNNPRNDVPECLVTVSPIQP